MALALKPIVQNVRVDRWNAEELATGRTLLPSPEDANLHVDIPFQARQKQANRQYLPRFALFVQLLSPVRRFIWNFLLAIVGSINPGEEAEETKVA